MNKQTRTTRRAPKITNSMPEEKSVLPLEPVRQSRRRLKDRKMIDAEITSCNIGYERSQARLAVVENENERERDERTINLTQANRMLGIISMCNQTVMRATEEAALLQEICNMIVDQGGYPLVWVAFVEQDTAETVHLVAQAGFEEGYLGTVSRVLADSELGQGPASMAIHSGQACVARDIQTDLNFAPWREESIRIGYASSIALPLWGDDRVLGVMNIYAAVPDAFHTEEIDLLMELAGDLAFGIMSLRERTARKHAEFALKESEERYRTLFERVPVALFRSTPTGKIVDANSAHTRILGYPSREAWFAQNTLDHYIDPQDRQKWRAIAERDGIVNDFEVQMRRYDGTIIWARLISQAVRDSEGRVVYYDGSIEDITERKRDEEAQRHRLVEFEALHTISTTLRLAQTREEALPILLDTTLAALETHAGIIWLYDPDSNELRATVSRDWFQQMSEAPMKPGEGIAGTVFVSGQTYLSAEFRSDPLTRMAVREQIPAGWGGICLPIRAGAVTIGVMFVSVPSIQQIKKEKVQLLESLTEIGGAALHRMSLHEETVHQLDQLQSLRRIDQAISASTDLRMTLNIFLDNVASQLKVDATDVLLLNSHTLTLEYAAGRGFRTHASERARIRLGESFAGRCALERCAVQLDRPGQIQESPQFAALWAGEGFVAYHAVPLIVKGQVKGVLEIFHRSPLVAGSGWFSFLETLAGQAAIAIENAQLFDHLQRSNVDLALAYDATIEGWARALDLRDKETEGHTRRVTELTERLARAMGIDGVEMIHIRRGALLHDIGKMSVPDSILFKPDKLTEEEWVIMRQHPQNAYDMLNSIAFLRPAIEIPYCHHERWDGTGYPRGLKGEQIPLAARHFAVVDVWDALSSDRPYRKSWSEERVLAYIKAGSGTHFDPRAVDLFLKMMSEKKQKKTSMN